MKRTTHNCICLLCFFALIKAIKNQFGFNIRFNLELAYILEIMVKDIVIKETEALVKAIIFKLYYIFLVYIGSKIIMLPTYKQEKIFYLDMESNNINLM